MAKERKRFYVVWRGRETGIFSSWEDARRQVEGYPKALYKGFASREEAERALEVGAAAYQGKPASQGRWRTAARKPILPSLAVDAACSGARAPFSYRGVRVADEVEVFRVGPVAVGTVNIGEFLAIVHALSWLARRGLAWPVYSDSRVARGWVTRGKCRSRLPKTEETLSTWDLIRRAEAWLAAHPDHAPVLPWDTRLWGEIPADFNRK